MDVATSVTSPRLVRELNLLRIVSEAESVTRSEIGDLTGLNQATVARLVTSLLDKGLIEVMGVGTDRGKRGRPSDRLRINPDAGYGLGLEFGRDHLVVVVTDALGELCFSQIIDDVPTFVLNNKTMDRLSAIGKQVAAKQGVEWERVCVFGLALHDLVNAQGEAVSLENAHAEPYSAQRYLNASLARPVVVEDVSRAFAVAEHRFGAGRDVPDMIYVFLGSHGVGGGIFVNNTMLKSSSGVCGEIGHLVIDENGLLCQCGSRGCLETVASHRAVVQQFRDLQREGVATSLREREVLSFAQICQAAEAGDKGAYLVLNRLAFNLGKALGSAINIGGAPVVVIGGTLSLAGESFLGDVSGVLRQRVIASLTKHISVRYAQLPPHAGAWGVAVQALEKAWTEGAFLTQEVPMKH